MDQRASDVAFSPAVKAEQARRGSRSQFERMERLKGWPNTVTPDLAAFLAEARSFYLATASASGQPYVQHRGGPRGVLKPIDETTLAFADYGGNRQYITLGNLAENEKAFIFIMDYARARRVKIWGTAKVVEGDEALLSKVMDPSYGATPERAILFSIEAWDRNCPQHIPRMLNFDDAAEVFGKLEQRIAALEAENKELKAQSAAN